eukprot:4295565-Heterocapsa_arctica.AAC.1
MGFSSRKLEVDEENTKKLVIDAIIGGTAQSLSHVFLSDPMPVTCADDGSNVDSYAQRHGNYDL